MRNEHKFQFTASMIASAAEAKAEYHKSRAEKWLDDYEYNVKRIKETASVKIVESPVTNGTRADVVVDYGDPYAYARMQEAWSKMNSHRDKQASFENDAVVYGTQGEHVYELSMSDVLHYGLSEIIKVA